MGPVVLLAGVLLLLYGGAALSSEHVAASRRLREQSRPYAVASLATGAVLVLAGLVAIVG